MNYINKWLTEAKRPKKEEPISPEELAKIELNKKRFSNIIDPSRVPGANKDGPPAFTQAQLDQMENERKKAIFKKLLAQQV